MVSQVNLYEFFTNLIKVCNVRKEFDVVEDDLLKMFEFFIDRFVKWFNLGLIKVKGIVAYFTRYWSDEDRHMKKQ